MPKGCAIIQLLFPNDQAYLHIIDLEDNKICTISKLNCRDIDNRIGNFNLFRFKLFHFFFTSIKARTMLSNNISKYQRALTS